MVRLDEFELRTEMFEHAGFSVEVLLPRSSEALIDEGEFESDERLPYWAELWPSSRALARVVLDDVVLPDRAIELGCGVGLPSLALRFRSVDVLATDYYRDALRFVRRNAWHNGIEPPRTLLLDWRSPPPQLGRFPLVIAADVLYEGRNVDALRGLLPSLVDDGGSMLLADPGRVHLEPFLAAMSEAGWSIQRLDERSEPAPARPDLDLRIRIIRLRPPGPTAAR